MDRGDDLRNGARYIPARVAATAIEAVVGEAGFEIIGSRPFERTGGRYALLSTLAHK